MFLLNIYLSLLYICRVVRRLLKCIRGRQEQNDSTKNVNAGDVEEGHANDSDEHKEMTIYERQGRRPSGHGIVKINEDSVELIDESYSKEGSGNIRPVAPPLPNDVEVKRKDDGAFFEKKTTKNVTFKDDVDEEMERSQRRASEKRKVIRRHSSSTHRPSLVDELQFAKEVILDEGADNRQVYRNSKNQSITQSINQSINHLFTHITPRNI
jgi:hypothetical protein